MSIEQHDPEGWVSTKIYILIDPRTDEVRYVGKTTQKLSTRVTAHMRDTCDCHRVHWLNELKSAGLLPHAVVIAEVAGEWPWQVEERYWIDKLKSMGARLTNNTSGGDGVPDLPKEVRERIRQASVGRRPTPETLEKLRIARRKRRASLETRRKTSESLKGRKITWTAKLAVAIRKLTPETVEIIKARLEAGEKNHALAAEYKVHRTTMSKIKTGTYFNPYRKHHAS